MQALPEQTDPAAAAKLCFTAAYTVIFMQEVLSVGVDERRVHFANSLVLDDRRRVHLDWPLGAALEFLVGTDAAAAGAGANGTGSEPASPWELHVAAFWLLVAAVLMACLTWARCAFVTRSDYNAPAVGARVPCPPRTRRAARDV